MTFKLCKIKLMLFCAAVLIIIGSVTAVAETVPENAESGGTGIILGDANSDGIVTISDVTCIQMAVAGIPLNCDFSLDAADVTGDEEINITDASYIQMWVAYFDTPYPIGERIEAPTEPTTEQPTEEQTEQTTEPTTQAPTQRPTDEEGWGRDIIRP